MNNRDFNIDPKYRDYDFSHNQAALIETPCLKLLTLSCVLDPGTGFDGDQALGVQLLQLGRRKRQVIHGEPLPLSCKAHLAWLGFTAEGECTPVWDSLEGSSTGRDDVQPAFKGDLLCFFDFYDL